MIQYYHQFTLTEITEGSPVPDGKKWRSAPWHGAKRSLKHEEHPERLKRWRTYRAVISVAFASDILVWMNAIYGITKRWEGVWEKLNARTVPQDVFEELVKAYSSPDRFYHNLTHIQDCLSLFDQTRSLAVQLEEVELAIWFHDAVYDTRRNDNEQKSAEWAVSAINRSGVEHAVAERVFNFVLATRHTTEVSDRDAQFVVDVDLSILGRETETYWQYENNIRKEYAWVPENLFRERRIEILRGFLDRKYIYFHARFRERFEDQARANLEQAIAKLIDAKGVAK